MDPKEIRRSMSKKKKKTYLGLCCEPHPSELHKGQAAERISESFCEVSACAYVTLNHIKLTYL